MKLVYALLALFAIAPALVAQEPEKPKEPWEMAEEEADRLQRVLELEDWQVFYVDSTLKHDYQGLMDEIGKLHPSNVSGILQFANVRNIYLINSSPMGYNADIYKYNYLLTKDGKSQTHIKRLMTINV